MCNRLVFVSVFFTRREALTVRKPQDFHCSPPALHAVIAWPVRTMATPSPLVLGCPSCGRSRPAVRTVFLPT